MKIRENIFMNVYRIKPWSNICGQDWEPTIIVEFSMGLYSGMLKHCPQILD